nr:splicing factor 3A subunit 3-like [Aotus nancymaae]
METILEQQRRYHEEKERLMDVMAKEMLTKKSTLRDQINSDHRTRAMQDVSALLSASLWVGEAGKERGSEVRVSA